MEMFQRILKTAIEGGASDVHLEDRQPRRLRINRQLIAIELSAADSGLDEPGGRAGNPAPFAPAHRGGNARRTFSYFIPSIGRFRTNLFQQRGQWCLAMRYVKTHVPGFEELGLLEQVKKIAESRGALSSWPVPRVAANPLRSPP